MMTTTRRRTRGLTPWSQVVANPRSETFLRNKREVAKQLSVSKVLERSRTVLCSMILVLMACCCSVSAYGQRVWDSPAFSASPKEILEAAASEQPAEDTAAVVVFKEEHYRFDAQGRSIHSMRKIYKVLTPDGVQGWSGVKYEWCPWYQERPSIRARVITADGVAHVLDPKTLKDSPIQDKDESVYSDRRTELGPLPAVAVGAVVEEEAIIQDTAAYFEQGVIRYVNLASEDPIRHWRVTLEAPASIPLHFVVRLLPGVQPQRTEADGSVKLVFEGGPTPHVVSEPYVASDIPVVPYIAFSIGLAWKDVASGYGAIVDKQIAAGDAAGTEDEGLKKGSLKETVAAISARLHRDVRYTGVEFGEASLVPASPAQILHRKYGDCKDKATLLVAMLRKAGVPAYVALLSTGPGLDIEPDLPGIGAFDHAIVYVPGPPGLWIDATNPFTRPGELPMMDQDRLALIAGSTTTGLVRTPEPTSAENGSVETREIYLAELGSARVIETTEATGAFEQSYRSHYSDPDPPETRTQLEKYVAVEYAASKLTHYEHSPTTDLSKPFRLKLEAASAARGTTGIEDAVVAIPVVELTSNLPSLLTEDEEETPASPSPETAAAGVEGGWARKADLVLPRPYHLEWRYRIVPPPGFRPAPLPPSVVKHLGPAVLSEQFNGEEDGTITATLRFDTVKRRMKPEEAVALHKGIRELQQENALIVRFIQIGETYLADGNVREALEEFRDYAASHPQDALAHTRIARALLAAGIGEGARNEALLATKIEPSSPVAYQTLALVLEHDLVGRMYGKGFDYAGAEAAFRKALELNSKDTVARGNFAILLEHDAKGRRYSPQAKLAEAIQQYQELGDKLGEVNLSKNLVIALMWARRFKDLKQQAGKETDTQGSRAFALVATAATDGPAAAIQEASREITNEEMRGSALIEAGNYLVQLRLYPQAADLIAAGAKGGPNAAAELNRAAFLRQTQRHEDVPVDNADPRSVVIKALGLMFSDEATPEDLAKISSHHCRDFDDSREFVDMKRGMMALRTEMSKQGLSLDLILDLFISNFPISVEGSDAAGYRLRVQVIGGAAVSTLVFLVTREDGQYKLLDSARSPTTLGSEVLERVGNVDLAGARHWLDWAREEMPLQGGEDPFAGPPFPRFWERGKQGDKDAIRYAAASILAEGEKTEVERAIPILQEGLAKAASDAERLRFDLALAHAFLKLKRYGEILPFSQPLLETAPTSDAAFVMTMSALRGLKRWPEFEHCAQDRLKRLPDDLLATRLLADGASRRGKLAAAIQLEQRMVSLGKADSGDYNQIAWFTLIDGSVTNQTIENSQRGNFLSKNADPTELHTLAALYAEVGKTTEARETLLRSMELRGLEEPDPDYWYVFGRIAEQFGVRDAAVADYQKLKPPDEGNALATSTYVLAQRRLAVLEREKGM